ncbi:hypothetical protein [Myxococcus sp. MxC21-1]|uniref:hypothetical protein n=1 Tax=Myxococcus sp. MxC21-1 TaxID=3041439 RepID=UPI0039776AF4
MPTGEVLLAGGTAATTAQRYEDVLAPPAWRPVVSAPETLYQTCPTVIEGQGFRGISGASSGSYLDSPTDFPLVRLRAAEEGGSGRFPPRTCPPRVRRYGCPRRRRRARMPCPSSPTPFRVDAW